MSEAKHVKIAFELEQDADGYPPDRWETMWALEVEGDLYSLDNIPLFARGVSSEDVIRASLLEDRLTFAEVVTPSANSVFRIYVTDVEDVQAARGAFKELGCESEGSYIPKLFAVEIPGAVSFDSVAKLLSSGSESGRWEYEEACLRHASPAE